MIGQIQQGDQGSIKASLNPPYDKLGKDYLVTVYDKGKFFLYDLMNNMGKDEFYQMLQEYYRDHAFKEVRTKDFQILHINILTKIL